LEFLRPDKIRFGHAGLGFEMFNAWRDLQLLARFEPMAAVTIRPIFPNLSHEPWLAPHNQLLSAAATERPRYDSTMNPGERPILGVASHHFELLS
jgi:hypothetical protein